MGDAYMQEREPTTEEMAEYYEAVRKQEEAARIRALQKHRVMFFLTEEDLQNILQLPEDVHFFGVQYNWRTRMLEVGVWGEPFEEVPDFCEAPGVFAEREWNEDSKVLKVTFPRTPGGNNA